ncbi:MAG: transporter substrate-binding domain-containing protein, partial [Bacteroidota bacterium]
MKYCLIGLFLLLFLNNTWSQTERDTLIVGYTSAPPFIVQEDELLTGINIWLWEEVASGLGLEYKLVPMNFAEMLSALETGTIDVSINPLTITSDRSKVIEFTHSFYASNATIAVTEISSFQKVVRFVKGFFNRNFLRGFFILFCIILIFGEPRTAIYAHMDSVGYTVGYDNALIRIGGPKAKEGSILVGKDSLGEIEGKLHFTIEDDGEDQRLVKTEIVFDRIIDRGTSLTYKPNFRKTKTHIQNCYLDDRLGIWNALKVAETLENGAIVFSAWEEVGGGSVGYLASYLYHKYKVRQALISDITW